MPRYKFRAAPDAPGKLKGHLDVEHQNLQRAIHGVVARTVTASTTVTASDYLILCDPTSAAIVVSFPDANGALDMEITVKQVSSNANTVTLDGTFDGAANPVLGAQNRALTVQSNGVAWWITGRVS